jgi:hypothetical protein
MLPPKLLLLLLLHHNEQISLNCIEARALGGISLKALRSRV